MSFSFKQFTIQQDRTAMKVCTDSCLFGAWTATNLVSFFGSEKISILDIGAGTGLLSLMLAQQLNVNIDAIEIDPAAASQARENAEASPWASGIHIHEGRIQDFIPDKKYDVIISNPPFYENDLLSPEKNKNAAKHDETLGLSELLEAFSKHIDQDGVGFMLLPYHRLNRVSELLEEFGFCIHVITKVRQSVDHGFFRVMVEFGRKENKLIENEISIHDGERIYTKEFVELLKEYYLRL